MRVKTAIVLAFLGVLSIAAIAMLAAGAPQQGSASSGTGTSAYAKDAAVVHNTGNESIGGQKTFTSELFGTSADFSGNLQVGGQLILTGPWSASGPVPGVTLTPTANTSQIAFNTVGTLVVSENDGSVTEVAKVASSNLSNYQTTSTAQAAYSGNGSCSNKVVTATNANAAPTCATVTSADVDGSIATNLSSEQISPGFSTSSTVQPFTSSNHAQLFGVFLSQPVTFSNFTVYVTADDNSSNTYDFCIYQGVSGSTDNLLAHTGAVAGSTYFTANSAFATVPALATTTLPAGRYYLMMYTNSASAVLTLAGTSQTIGFYHLAGFSITPVTGACPATITGPSDSYSTAIQPAVVLH